MKLQLFLLLVLTGVNPAPQTFYRRFHLILQTRTWTDAQTYCRTVYTDLATIEHDHEVNQLQNLVVVNAVPSNVNMWIGLYDDFNGWRWSMGDEPLGLYRKWYPSNPDNYLSSEHCGMIDLLGWFDNSCGEQLPFICSDVRYTGASSFIYVSTTMTWSEARSYCRQHHTDLAVVRNSVENNILMGRITGRTWFGLYRDSWKWSDGTKFTSISWTSGEPNNALKYEQCVVFGNTQALDILCSRLKPFVCEEVITGKIQIARIQLQSNQEVNDPALQAAILDQMRRILSNHGNITVKWRKQPNGSVIQRI